MTAAFKAVWAPLQHKAIVMWQVMQIFYQMLNCSSLRWQPLFPVFKILIFSYWQDYFVIYIF